MTRSAVLVLLALALIFRQADARAVTFDVAPRSWTVDIYGVPVNLTARAKGEITPSPPSLDAVIEIIVSLADLQDKLGQIIATFPLPRDNCASYKPDNIVGAFSSAGLAPRDSTALLVLTGSIEMWTCIENPIPNSKVEMQTKDIGFGIKTDVPVVVTWPGDPIKTRIASQPFNASVQFELETDGQSVDLQPRQPAIDLTGQYASTTEDVLKIADVDINSLALDALRKAIDWNALRACVPAELKPMDLIFQRVAFVEDNGRLAVEVALAGKLTGSAAVQLGAQAANFRQLSFTCP